MLFPDLRWVWEAFWRLSPSRSVGMAIGAISFEACDRYAERYGVGDFEEFYGLIRAMDGAYLKHANRKDDG